MNRRTLLASAAAAVAAAPLATRAQAQGQVKTKIVFWHAMSGQLGEEVKRLCTGFNAAQSAAEIEPVFKGSYTETLTAAIAAWRAGQAPHLVQMFEVGTGSMLAAGPAVKQTWELIRDSGVAINPESYIPAVRGYYSLPDGRLASMPFNSSTGVVFYNKDAFAKAGLDPEKPPATWAEMVAAARALKEKSAAPTPMSTSWFPWLQLEQFAAMHDLPYATKANGFEGLDTELLVNAAPFVQQVQRFVDMQKDGLFRYAGRDNAPDPIFAAGEAAILFASSGLRGGITKDAKFRWGETFIPFDPALRAQPLNTVIGGASLWTMTAPNRPAAEYKAVAEFLQYIAQPKQDAEWHQRTGYVPVTLAGYELSKQEGFYDKNPGADVPVLSLARGTTTPNSRGFRLGRMPEIRNIEYEEIERALSGGQSAKAAMDNVVSRGNRVLREFERQNRK